MRKKHRKFKKIAVCTALAILAAAMLSAGIFLLIRFKRRRRRPPNKVGESADIKAETIRHRPEKAPEKPAEGEVLHNKGDGKMLKNHHRARKILKYISVLLVAAAVCIGGLYIWSGIESRTISYSYYAVYPEHVVAPMRAVVLADLHQKEFGIGNQDLIDRIKELEPDMILIAGDTLNAKDPDVRYAVDLCTRLQAIAPVYFGMGNHDDIAVYGMALTKEDLDEIGYSGEDFSSLVVDGSLFSGLEKAGVTVLQNSSVTAEINGNTVLIGGMSTNMDAAWPYSGKFITRFMADDTAQCKIMISHYPEASARVFSGSSVDLVVSGHNHGGIIRLPGLGGLLSGDEGLFPKYDAGMKSLDGPELVISRGLGNHGIIPRLFNPPELVIVDIS